MNGRVLLIITLLLGIMAPTASAGDAPRYGSLPLAFEPSEGNPRAFVARSDGYLLSIAGGSVSLRLRRNGVPLNLSWRLTGANLDAAGVAANELPGRSNYLIGPDPRNWRVGVPTYATLRYANVYPGIDLVFYGKQGELEHDFVLAPGAKVTAIRFSLSKNPVRIDHRGDLLLDRNETRLRLRRPVAYQTMADGSRRKIGVRYSFNRDGTISFKLKEYDHSRALVIDPIFTYSTYLAGTFGEYGKGIAVDSQGNAYVTGMTWSGDFPTQNAYQSTCKSCTNSPDVFVSKLNSTGTALIYSTFLGGGGYDEPNSIAVDSNGNAVVGGRTDSVDFPLLANPAWGVYKGSNCTHGFLFSLNVAGSGLNFSTYIGGSGDDWVSGVAVDSNGNIYATGSTDSGDFPVTPGTLPAPTPAYPINDLFAMKFTPAGALTFSALIAPTMKSTSPWANSLSVSGIAVDKSGDPYITGWASDGFPTTPGSYQPLFKGNPNAQSYNAYVAKLNSAGSAILYGSYIGGTNGWDKSYAIAVDDTGSAYIAGSAGSSDFPTTPAAFQTSIKTASGGTACCAAFVSKFDPTGGTLEYSSFLSGTMTFSSTNGSSIWGIAVNNAGEAAVAGQTATTDFPLVAPLIFQSGSGATTFVTQFNATGSALLFSSYYGGSRGSQGSGITLDGSGGIYITGTTYDTDLPTTSGAFQTSVAPPPQYVTPDHAFVARIDTSTGGPAACVVPSPLVFLQTPVGNSSSKGVTLSNCGTQSMTINSIATVGVFAETNNCATTLAVNASCNITVTFTPTAAGTQTGTLTITTNSPISPARIALSGTGTVPVLSPQAMELTLPDTLIGTTSPDQWLILSNTGGATLTISSISVTGDFSQTNECSQPVYPTQSCLVYVRFSPTAAGTRTGTLTISSNDPTGPKTVALTGLGLSAYPIPTVTDTEPQFVPAGNTAVQLNVMGTGIFPASVIRINGADRPTENNVTYLSTTLSPEELASMGEVEVTVFNPAPGGGSSSPAYVTVYQALNMSAAGLTYDPYSRQLFAALPSGALSYPNSVVAINPLTASVLSATPIGNEPGKVVPTGDGQFLYVGLNGDNAVRRYDILSATAGPQIALPSDPTYGPMRAYDIVPLPNDAHSFLVMLQRSGVSPSEGGVALFTDTTLRTFLPDEYPAWTQIDTMRFVSDPSVAYGQTNSGYNFTQFTVGSSGLTAGTAAPLSPMGPGELESDGTYLFSSNGKVFDPVAQKSIGQYGSTAFRVSVVPDSPLGRTFFADYTQVEGYDQSSFASIGTIALPTSTGRADLVRWGADGFAFREVDDNDHSKDQIVIFRSRLARPNAGTTLNPTLTSISPASIASGTGNLLLTMTGTNFVAGAVLLLNQTELTTTFVNATTLKAYVAASDIAFAASDTVSVKNPNGSTSGSVNFTITGGLSATPQSLTFGSQAIGTSTVAQTITFTNGGSSALALTLSTTGDFTQSNTCGTSVGAGKSCTAAVVFTPSAGGQRGGTLRAATGATVGVIQLEGVGIAGSVSLSSDSVAFGNQLVGATAATKTVTLTNGTGSAVAVSAVAAGTGFTQTNNCSTVAAGANCTISVGFKPAAPGTIIATLTVRLGDGSTIAATLSGTGSDFALAAATGGSTTGSVTAGRTANYSLSVSPAGGFAGDVALTCSSPATMHCTVSPTTVTVGSGPAPFTVVVSTTAASGGMTSRPPLGPPSNRTFAIWWGALAVFSVVLLRRTRRWVPVFALIVLAFMPGCGGGNNSHTIQPGTSPGSYTVTVTATSSGVSRTLNLTLTVQ